ncbi:unnamed protein product [Polarella glacialis]|uniref:Uncharacterized protein n=1 Tax=Polarella glacialis TaxID=89957 RepID=A0A813DDH5_POLGL|nr:unnamed protein product [Polarella glacialis]
MLSDGDFVPEGSATGSSFVENWQDVQHRGNPEEGELEDEQSQWAVGEIQNPVRDEEVEELDDFELELDDDGGELWHILVKQVEEVQARSSDWQTFWDGFCDSRRGGMGRDAHKHTAASLRCFLDAAAESTKLAIQVAPWKQLVQMTSDLKRARHLRGRWDTYCDEFGGGTKDPKLHKPEYLQEFLSGIAVMLDDQMQIGTSDADVAEAVAWAGACFPPGNSTSSSSSSSASVVNAPWRRAGGARQQTATHAEEAKEPTGQGGGKAIRFTGSLQGRGDADKSARLSTTVILKKRRLLDETAGQSGGAIASSSESMSERVSRVSESRPPWQLPSRARSVDTADVLSNVQNSEVESGHAALALKVRELQKSDPETAEAWRVLCDAFGNGTRDPLKHDEAFLRKFLSAAVKPGGSGGRHAKSSIRTTGSVGSVSVQEASQDNPKCRRSFAATSFLSQKVKRLATAARTPVSVRSEAASTKSRLVPFGAAAPLKRFRTS